MGAPPDDSFGFMKLAERVAQPKEKKKDIQEISLVADLRCTRPERRESEERMWPVSYEDNRGGDVVPHPIRSH